jgi:signal transduction histidine kinase
MLVFINEHVLPFSASSKPEFKCRRLNQRNLCRALYWSSWVQALTVQRATEKVAFAKLKELAYIRQEIKNPLFGIMFTRNLMEDTDLSDDQRQFVETSAVCEQQLRKILDDMDLESIEDG